MTDRPFRFFLFHFCFCARTGGEDDRRLGADVHQVFDHGGGAGRGCLAYRGRCRGGSRLRRGRTSTPRQVSVFCFSHEGTKKMTTDFPETSTEKCGCGVPWQVRMSCAAIRNVGRFSCVDSSIERIVCTTVFIGRFE